MPTNETNKLVVTFSANGDSDPILVNGNFTVQVRGTFVATITLKRSLDNGSNYGAAISTYTAPDDENGFEPGLAALYRFTCSGYSSGSAICTLERR